MRVGGGKEKEDSCNEERVWVGEEGGGRDQGGGGGGRGRAMRKEWEQESYMRQFSKKFHS